MAKFLIKLLVNGIIVIPLLMWFADTTFFSALVAAVLLSAVSYWVGDQMVLRMTNNAFATLCDILLAAVFLWIAADLMDWPLAFWELSTIVILLGIAEMVFHRYLGYAPTQRAGA